MAQKYVHYRVNGVDFYLSNDLPNDELQKAVMQDRLKAKQDGVSFDVTPTEEARLKTATPEELKLDAYKAVQTAFIQLDGKYAPNEIINLSKEQDTTDQDLKELDDLAKGITLS